MKLLIPILLVFSQGAFAESENLVSPLGYAIGAAGATAAADNAYYRSSATFISPPVSYRDTAIDEILDNDRTPSSGKVTIIQQVRNLNGKEAKDFLLQQAQQKRNELNKRLNKLIDKGAMPAHPDGYGHTYNYHNYDAPQAWNKEIYDGFGNSKATVAAQPVYKELVATDERLNAIRRMSENQAMAEANYQRKVVNYKNLNDLESKLRVHTNDSTLKATTSRTLGRQLKRGGKIAAVVFGAGVILNKMATPAEAGTIEYSDVDLDAMDDMQATE